MLPPPAWTPLHELCNSARPEDWSAASAWEASDPGALQKVERYTYIYRPREREREVDHQHRIGSNFLMEVEPQRVEMNVAIRRNSPHYHSMAFRR